MMRSGGGVSSWEEVASAVWGMMSVVVPVSHGVFDLPWPRDPRLGPDFRSLGYCLPTPGFQGGPKQPTLPRSPEETAGISTSRL